MVVGFCQFGHPLALGGWIKLRWNVCVCVCVCVCEVKEEGDGRGEGTNWEGGTAREGETGRLEVGVWGKSCAWWDGIGWGGVGWVRK